MGRLRMTLALMLGGLLLTFNTLAITLLALDRCISDPVVVLDMHADCADMPEDSWLQSTAEILCEAGADCPVGGALLASSALLLLAPTPQPFIHAPLPSPSGPWIDDFWRPPRQAFPL